MSQFDENKGFYRGLTNFGDGGRNGTQFSDRDLTPKEVQKGCTLYGADDALASNVSQEIAVNVSASNRGLNDNSFGNWQRTSAEAPAYLPDVTASDPFLEGRRREELIRRGDVIEKISKGVCPMCDGTGKLG